MNSRDYSLLVKGGESNTLSVMLIICRAPTADTRANGQRYLAALETQKLGINQYFD
jgi:hypothetical protein